MADEEQVFELTTTEDEDGSSLYQCSSCNVTFIDIDEHCAKFHPNETLVQEQPDKEIVEAIEEPEDETVTFTQTSDSSFKCSVCPSTYKTMKKIIEHVRNHNNRQKMSLRKTKKRKLDDNFEELTVKNVTKFRCKVCKAIFPTGKQIRLHYQIHKNVAAAKAKGTPNSQESLLCKLCNRSMNNARELAMHISAHNENAGHGLKSSQVKAVPIKRSKESASGLHQCQYCKKEFVRPHEKVKHERVHTGEKPFACEICGKRFRVTYCLSLHKRNVHSDERPYICSFDGCTKRFKSQSVYNHHINTHGTAKNYPCPTCDKAFKTSVQLAGHKKTHTKPFSCNQCNRTFSSLYAVKLHMAVHKDQETNLKFSCKICSAQYGRLFALNDHLKTSHPGMENQEAEEHYLIDEVDAPTEVDDEVYSVYVEKDDKLN